MSVNDYMINENIANGLKQPSPRTPQFYISPKTHKEDDPGRPVVCYHYNLQPFVKQIPSYIKDSNDFINKINTVKSVPKKQLPGNKEMTTLTKREYQL